MGKALLFVSDEKVRVLVEETLEGEGIDVQVATEADEVRKGLEENHYALFILDSCPEKADLSDFLTPARASGVGATILLDANPTPGDEGVLGRLGVAAFLASPLDLPALRSIALQNRGSTALDSEGQRFGLLVGASAPMKRLQGILRRIAPSQANVLITGESGSGKELVARTIHDLSPRRKKPFLPVNCGALSPSLMESELFGHERGSFTGADRRHRGIFERADGGTLFLDEITEMPAELQVKLLRVLETGLVTGVGREDPTRVDVRVLAATNRDPRKAVQEGRLREDLYYRLRVLQVDLPPLRERLDDVPILAHWFLKEIAEREGRRKVLSDEAVAALMKYTWPGNVRELRNALYTMYLLSPHGSISISVLQPEIRKVVFGDEPREWTRAEAAGRSLKEIERHHILLTLEEVNGHKRRASELLGVSLKTLYNRLNAYKTDGAGAGSPASLDGSRSGDGTRS